MSFYKVSWTELEKDCYKLAKKIKLHKFDRILCISRGGLVWARIFSDLLSLPISHLTVESYKDLKQHKTTAITETPARLKSKSLLVVDEISDTGKTYRIVINYLRSLKIYNFKTLAPIIRTFTKPIPDFYLKTIDDWIIYPYELRETYDAFLKIYKTREKTIEMLLKNGFKKSEIRFL